MGDPAGIGPDISLSTWLRRNELAIPPFLLIGDPGVLADRARTLGLDVPIAEAGPSAAAEVFRDALPVLPVQTAEHCRAGSPDPTNAAAVISAIEQAVALSLEGACSATVTNPIAKSVLYAAGFRFPGHTEFLADLAAMATGRSVMPVMMLAGPRLRAVPVTIHIPLSAVPGALSRDLIERTCRIVAADLISRFGIARPRLAVSGLNPHAGEGGALGAEDEAVVRPAVEQIRSEGIDAVGPLPADTMFHDEARSHYDVAVCMYHDQALIPAKALGFDDSVNVTLGLPFIRTSPDHGTAFALAGTGTARPDSLVAALRMAVELAARVRARKGRGAGDAVTASFDGLPPLRDVIARHGIGARKALGQNFLLDLNLTQKVARAAGDLSKATVVEVGPGPGGLTRALLALGARNVIAVERDPRCLPALEEIGAHYPGRLAVLEGDALDLVPAGLPPRQGPLKIVANLPYNVGTQLLVKWLLAEPWPPFYESLTLMFQREVAERIVAAPGTGAYGRLAVIAGWRTAARIMFDVAPQAFTPPPKVTSSVVHMVPRERPIACPPHALERVTQAAFGQRRKMLRQSLKPLGGEALLEAVGIDPRRRAETLSVEEFCALANALEG